MINIGFPPAVLEFNKQFFQVGTFNLQRLKINYPDYLLDSQTVKSSLANAFYFSVSAVNNLGLISVLVGVIPGLFVIARLIELIMKKAC